MTLPIPSNVFADGELVDEASLYARLFTPINTMYATLSALPLIQHGNFTATWTTASILATGTVTFPLGFAGAPDVIVSCAAFGGNVPVTINLNGVTATTFSYRASFFSGSGTANGTATGYYIATRG